MSSSFTKSEEVAARLKEMIHKMLKSKEAKVPTEKKLSELFGVSRGTVRRATEKFVSAGILHKTAGCGTFINNEILTHGVFLKKSIKTVVLVYDILDISDFRYRIIRGVVKAANAKGYDTAIASFDNAMEIFREKLFAVDQKDIAMASCNFSTAHIQAIKKFPVKIPYIALNNYRYKDIAEYAVLSTPWLEYGLAYLPTIGHKRILIFHDSLTKPCIEEVTNAVKTVETNTDIKLNVILKECRYEYNRVVSELNTIFSKSTLNKPTAILCLDDKIATWTISHLKNMSVSVPGDVSVLGTGDFDICESTYPRITTTSLDYDSMGEMAIDLIDRQIESKEPLEEKLVFVHNHLIERDSCKKI